MVFFFNLFKELFALFDLSASQFLCQLCTYVIKPVKSQVDAYAFQRVSCTKSSFSIFCFQGIFQIRAPCTAKQMQAIMGELKNITNAEPVVTIKSAMKEADIAQLEALADALMA